MSSPFLYTAESAVSFFTAATVAISGDRAEWDFKCEAAVASEKRGEDCALAAGDRALRGGEFGVRLADVLPSNGKEVADGETDGSERGDTICFSGDCWSVNSLPGEGVETATLVGRSPVRGVMRLDAEEAVGRVKRSVRLRRIDGFVLAVDGEGV